MSCRSAGAWDPPALRSCNHDCQGWRNGRTAVLGARGSPLSARWHAATSEGADVDVVAAEEHHVGEETRTLQRCLR